MKFEELIHSDNIIKALESQGIKEPTQIQQDAYIHIKNNENVIARSETGSGKTLAYLIPIFENIDVEEKGVNTIILVPTYELSMQVYNQIELLSANSKINVRALSLIGNVNITRQIEQLKNKKPHIIVGTSGRILELIKKKKISAHTVKTLIIDEADKMLDKNNYQPMMDVRKCLYKNIQILLFSASMNKKAFTIAGEIAPKACIIKYNDSETIPSLITHQYIICAKNQKTETLRKVCAAIKPTRCMIFIDKQFEAQEVYDKLSYHHYKIDNLIGKSDKFERKNALERFKSGKSNYLLSTDIASRGLHIDGVDTVINIGLPTDSKDYLHRCGRCGRNNQKGLCISIITENELNKVKNLQKAFNINMVCRKLFNGKLVKG